MNDTTKAATLASDNVFKPLHLQVMDNYPTNAVTMDGDLEDKDFNPNEYESENLHLQVVANDSTEAVTHRSIKV